ncbi:hypothetical protein HFD88_006726 [Aspergillus terreus]|nr:hypothetical protein HFD88_006726 [Aspergillus terreus]
MAYYDERQYYPPTRDRHSRPATGHAQDYYGGHPSHTDVVPRPNFSNESIEEIPRDYPPGDYAYEYGHGYPPPRHSRVATVQEGVRRSHSLGGGARGGPYYDESDYYYRPSRGRHSRHHDDRRGHYKYSRSPSSSRSPPRRRRKSLSEQALSALGLGSAAASGSRHHERSRSRGRRDHHGRSYSYSPSPTRGHRGSHHRDKSEQRIAQAVKAAVTAGAVEAFRLRKDKGEWTGEKGKRILTAALTAGGTDGLVDRDPGKHSKRHIIESTLAGLAANHFVNGPRSHSRSRSRHGSRHRSHSRVRDLAATGALAAAGKEAWSRYQRSRSRPRRGRSLSRDGSYDDSESSPGRRPRRQRSRSVSDYISRGLEALGLDSSKEKEREEPRRRHRHRSSRYDGPDDADGYYYSDADDWDSEYGRGRHGGSRRTRHPRDVGLPPPHISRNTTTAPRSGPKHPATEQDSDQDNSTDEDRQRKKLTRDTLVATGLATVATIHAAHGLHESMEKHKRNTQMVREGDMSPEEARRRRLKNNFSDAANVGLAALGVKGVVGSWKHADEKRRERASFKRERSLRRERRMREVLPRRASSHGAVPRTRYPDEVEENLSSPARRESIF